MDSAPCKIQKFQRDEQSDNENSDDGLQIVLKSPIPKRKNKPELNDSDKQIIASLEDDLEQNLEEKAAKAKLTAVNVKTILKQVVTNEHVLAMVRQAENPEENQESVPPYEPKFTRAKTKALLSTGNTPPLTIPSCYSPKSPSEVQVLLNEELQEESDDEYIPETISKLDISNDDIRETPVNSTLDSNDDDDDDDDEDDDDNDEQTNIALRTRSKLSLNSTPLEVIERAFMPPDITTDMYNMDCDDDVWTEFLKTFTKPLDEVAKATEDDDQDPEYNILADDEIDKVDKEELRADRAVTVSKKEFNVLMAELFEFAADYESKQKEKDHVPEEKLESTPNVVQQIIISGNLNWDDEENDPTIMFKKRQISLLGQQMRQHVQMLVQNFLLTFEHPEYSDLAVKYKEYLYRFKAESSEKTWSLFNTVNLNSALKLVEYWEYLFKHNGPEVRETKDHVERVLVESIESKTAGRDYVPTFPPLILKTISYSDVFLYANLLPRIPFKPYHISRTIYYHFTQSENSLIALFLEQIIPSLKDDAYYLNHQKEVNIRRIAFLIHQYLMPWINPKKIERHIQHNKHPNADENPIKFYFRNKRAPTTVHYVVPLDVLQVLPPCQRCADSLPLLWRNYIYPVQHTPFSVNCNGSTLIISQNNNCITKNNLYLNNITSTYRKIAPKPQTYSSPVAYSTRQRRNVVRKTVNSLSKRQTTRKMLPDMPSLSTPSPVKNQSNTEQLKDKDKIDKVAVQLQFDECGASTSSQAENEKIQECTPSSTTDSITISSSQEKYSINNSKCIQECVSSSDNRVVMNTEKDNLDDINELMIASSTVKTVPRKEPGGAEKKRAKLRREFLANLVMVTPEDPEIVNQKADSFVDAYLEKLRENLSLDEYNKLLNILAEYDENNGAFMDLYTNVQDILGTKYKELSDEFLLFLTDIQAQAVGELMPYFMMKDMARFMRKVQIYFKDQPSQMKKIMKSLTELSEIPNVTMDTIKSTILPLLKGNTALTDWFTQLFPSEHPPNILIKDVSYEVVDIGKELARLPGEDIYETVTVPDMDDPFGGTSCVCTCHNVDNSQFKTRSLHCTQCGIKFIQGKVYIQTRKGLRPANVDFPSNPGKDHTKRLNAPVKKKGEASPGKNVSPNKEQDEFRHNNESEEDCKKKSTKSRRNQRVTNTNVKNRKPKTTDKTKSVIKISKKSPTKKTSVNKRTKNGTQNQCKPGSNPGQLKRLADNNCESIENVELKHSTDNIVDISDSKIRNLNSTVDTWTRDEDKIILETFRKRNNDVENFKRISQLLPSRSTQEIKTRFHKLMALLQEMATSSGT